MADPRLPSFITCLSDKDRKLVSIQKYTIDPIDQSELNVNFQKALIKYLQLTHITELNSVPDEQISWNEVEKILSRKEKVILECYDPYGISTATVFPKLSSNALISGNYQKLSSVVDGLVKYCVTINLHHWIPHRAENISSPELDSDLSKSEALFLLEQLRQRQNVNVFDDINKRMTKEKYKKYRMLNISGAMLLPEHRMLLFQTEPGNNHFIHYGRNSSIGTFRLFFDVEDGFSMRVEDEKVFGNELDSTHPFFIKSSPNGVVLLKCLMTLQTSFEAWKKNNYQGDVIPENQSGLTYVASLQKPLFAQKGGPSLYASGNDNQVKNNDADSFVKFLNVRGII